MPLLHFHEGIFIVYASLVRTKSHYIQFISHIMAIFAYRTIHTLIWHKEAENNKRKVVHKRVSASYAVVFTKWHQTTNQPKNSSNLLLLNFLNRL